MRVRQRALASKFECPYCMTYNDIEIDFQNDIEQTQIVDCQICCQPIDIIVHNNEFGIQIEAKRDYD
ncbi:CPXCG motif-containing cysteine-rich protein [Alteromonas sp. 5E99-2]|uniref:CPXCG motif-containing cysteine-rich protein n=1 Tax=Alteromonas sp. 5E99-2 TaxID=2817683 RepID=UPI00325B89BE